MNYPGGATLFNTPYDNPFTKVAAGVGLLYVGFLGVKYCQADDNEPVRRKSRQNFTSSKVDQAIDHRNRVYSGKHPKSNPKIPFYSRHNQTRRRRGKIFL